METIVPAITGALDGLDAQLLLLVPVALGVTVITWGTPRMVGFFKKIAK